MSDFGRIRDNVQKMVDQSAPAEDIDGYLSTEGFSPKEFKTANENYGTFVSSIKRGGKDVGSLIGDWLPMMGADVLQKIAPESWKPKLEEYKQKQYKEAIQTQEEIAKRYPTEFESYKDIQDFKGGLGYAKEAIGENLVSLVPTLLTSGLGGLASRGAVAAAKIGAEDFALAAAKQAAQRGVPGAAEEFVSGIAQSQAAKAGAQAAARKALQYEAAGALAGSALQNVPEAYQTLYSPEHQDVLVPALISGSFNSLLDAVTPLNTLRIMKNKGITPNELMGAWYKRGAKALGEGVLTEGTTEMLQESSNIAAEKFVDKHKDIFSPENLTRIIDAGLKGGIGGGVFSGGLGAITGRNVPEAPPSIPQPGPLTPAQAGVTPTEAEPQFTPLTGERDLLGMTPEGALAAPTERMRPILGPDGRVRGYEPVPAATPARELTGEQLHLQPAEADLFTGEPSVQPTTTGRAEPLVNEQGQPIVPATPKSVDQMVMGVYEGAKQDPAASKILKGNNPASAKAVIARIQGLMGAEEADPIKAMEDLYYQDKTGKYPAGTKSLSDAQRELLEATYRRTTGRDIDSAVNERTYRQAVQGDLFGGAESAQGKTEADTGAAPPDVGVSGGAGAEVAPGAGGVGAGGVGVGGGEPSVGGPVGGEEVQPAPLAQPQILGKPEPVNPEQAWNEHRNDDHPAYADLSPEEKAAWNAVAASGRANAINFQDVVEEYNKRIARESKRTPEQVEQALLKVHGPAMTQDIESSITGKTFDQVLNYLANHGPEANRAIVRKIQQRAKELRKVGFSFKFKVAQTPEQARTLGYEPGVLGRVLAPRLDKVVDISVAGKNSGQPFGAQIRTTTHESLHAVTAAMVIYGELNERTPAGKIVKQLNSLSDYVRKYLEDKQRTTGLTPAEDKVLNGTNALGNQDSRGKRYHKAHEMVSHGMTTAEMQYVLETIPYSKTKSVYSHFVSLVRELLGLAPKQTTALSEVIRLSEELMSGSAAPLQETLRKGVTLAESKAAAPTTPKNVPGVGQPYTLPRTSKVQAAPTARQQVIDGVEKVNKAFHGDWWTKFRIAAVDPASGLMKTLSSLPVFQNGQLRADMLVRAFNQSINLIKNGLQTGVPVLNADGSVVIKADANNMQRLHKLADALDANSMVRGTGMTGREYVGEAMRILRGKEIMEEDASVRAEAARNLAYARQLVAKAKAMRLEGAPLTDIIKMVNKAKALRNQWREALHLNREKLITDSHIAWAEQQLKAVPELNEIFDVWRNINHALIKLNEDAGVLNSATADRYRSKKYYVPLFLSRVDLAPEEQEHYTGKRPGTKSVAEQYHLEGSTEQRNIWENLDKLYASATATAYQNQTRKVAFRQLRSDGINAARYAKSASDENINLRFRDPTDPNADENGIVHAILDNPNDLPAFQMMSYELNPIMKGFSATTQVLRAGALINPMYWVKQLIRDPMHAALVTNSGIVTPFHAGAEYVRILANNSKEARILAEHGVIGAVDPTIDLNNYLKQVGTQKLNPNMTQKALHNVMRMHEASDAATRVAIYKKAFKAGLAQGMSQEDAKNYAVHTARESINFSVRGNSKTLNTLRNMIPFFSAAITSLDTLYRAATGYGLNPQEKAQMQRIFLSRAAMMVVMSSIYAILMQDNEDYQKLPDNVKDDNWLFPSPIGSDHTFVKIPVPFEIGFMFKTIPEGAIRYLSDNSTGKEMLASYRRGLLRNLPGEGILIPQAAKPALEVLTNYSFFTDRPIEGMSDQGLPVEMRGAHASELAKVLSKMGLKEINLSPARIDHLIQGYFAELGTFSSGIAGNMVAAAEGKESPVKNIEQSPGFKAFLTNPYTSKAATDFYELTHSSQEAVNAFNRLKKEGRGEEAKEFISDEERKKQVAVAPALRRIQDQMAKLRAAMNYYENNERSGTPEERRDRINELKIVYNRVAEQGYKVAKAADLSR